MNARLVFLFALASLSFAAQAAADPLPFSQAIQLRPNTPRVVARVTTEGDRSLLALGPENSRENLDLPWVVAEVQFETVAVSPREQLLLLSLLSSGRREIVILRAGNRGTEVLWRARTDWHGDPGERQRGVVTTHDRTGDGIADVVVGWRREGIQVCGESQTLLFPRAYHTRDGRMVPVVVNPVTANGPTATVTASERSPGPQTPPILQTLDIVGVSSAVGLGENPGALAPMPALTDGDWSTAWYEGRGGAGHSEFIAARWSGPFPIQAVALVLPEASDDGSLVAFPSRVRLVGDNGASLVAQLPARGPGMGQQRLWIVPPRPLDWRCMTLVIEDVDAPPNAGAARAGVAEIEAYSRLDFGDGVSELAELLVSGGALGDRAVRWLGELGDPAAQAIASVWPRLDPLGKRRGIRALAQMGQALHEDGLQLLATAAQPASSPELRTLALNTLARLGQTAEPVFAQLMEHDVSDVEFLLPYCTRALGARARDLLWSQMQRPGGENLPRLRRALARLVVAESDAQTQATLMLTSNTGLSARISLLLGLVQANPAESHQAWLAARSHEAATFPDRWRLVRAAAALPPYASVDDWLAEQARSADEWMLREAAISALARRESPNVARVFAAALQDEYPRVRARALVLTTVDDTNLRSVARMAIADAWPMVREAALSKLGPEPSAAPVIIRAVNDRSALVRARAIAILREYPAPGASAPIIARLSRPREAVPVVEAALAFIGEQCVRRAEVQVLERLRLGLRPQPTPQQQGLAARALLTALRLGGETGADARRLAQRPGAPEGLGQLVARWNADSRAICAD